MSLFASIERTSLNRADQEARDAGQGFSRAIEALVSC